MSKLSQGWALAKKEKRDSDPSKASRGWVYGSIACCWLIEMFPIAAEPFVPNFLMLSLVFWAIYQPQRLYFALVFFLGLLVDAGSGAVFGQNAFIFCSIVYATELMSQRLQWLPWIGQAVSIFPVMMIAPVFMTVEAAFLGTFAFDWSWYYKAGVSVVIWPFWSWLLSGHFLSKRE
jgi:rod shape-determining protein MreD